MCGLLARRMTATSLSSDSRSLGVSLNESTTLTAATRPSGWLAAYTDAKLPVPSSRPRRHCSTLASTAAMARHRQGRAGQAASK